MADRRYNNGVWQGNPDTRPICKSVRLSDFGWTDTNYTVDDYRPIFRLIGHSACLYRDNGGFVVDAGRGMIKFFPVGTSMNEITEWAKKMTRKPDDYIVIESAGGTTRVSRDGKIRFEPAATPQWRKG